MNSMCGAGELLFVQRTVILFPRARAHLIVCSAELFILIVLGSVPTLRPVYERLIRGQKDFGRGKRYPSNEFYQLGPHTSKHPTRRNSAAKRSQGSSQPERSLSVEYDEIEVSKDASRHTFQVSAGADESNSFPASLREVDSRPTVTVSHSIL